MSRAVIVLLAFAAGCGAAPAPEAAPPSNEAAAPAPVAGGVQYVGDPRARVQLAYWFDYECPHCVAFSPTLDELERTYGDHIVVYYKNFPLSQHPRARAAAITAEAARRQGKFIEMHRRLIATSAAYDDAALREDASLLGLDLGQYDADVADPEAGAAIDREVAEGDALGIQYVPYLSINGAEHTGELDVATLAATIDARLAD